MDVKTVDLKDEDWEKQFVESIKNTGFALIKNHGVSYELIQQVQDEWKELFFKRELDHKMKFKYSETSQNGYFPFKSENAKGQYFSDLKEFYHYFREDYIPDDMSDSTSLLYEELDTVGMLLLSVLSNGYKDGAVNFTEMCINNKTTLFRPIYYPPLNGTEKEVRAAAHEDINFITILPAATAVGLQVKDLNENWSDVEFDPDTLVVNVGDMLQMITEGFYKSTSHRVVNVSDGSDRIATPLFIHARPEVKLNSIYTAKTYLSERLQEIGLQ